MSSKEEEKPVMNCAEPGRGGGGFPGIRFSEDPLSEFDVFLAWQASPAGALSSPKPLSVASQFGMAAGS